MKFFDDVSKFNEEIKKDLNYEVSLM